MASYRARPSRAERAQAFVAVILLHLALGAIVLSGATRFAAAPQPPPTRLIDISLPPPPPEPPPPPHHAARAATRAAGQAARKANPTPIVAPPAVVVLKAPAVVAAPVAGTGAAPSAGAGVSGTGSGAGGTGNGPGGGGPGGGGIGEDARLLSGGLDRRDYRRLRSFAAPEGHAVIGLLVGPDGRVAQCSIRQSSGDSGLDEDLCAILQPRMRWAPARDRAGRALTVGIVYTAIWSRD